MIHVKISYSSYSEAMEEAPTLSRLYYGTATGIFAFTAASYFNHFPCLLLTVDELRGS